MIFRDMQESRDEQGSPTRFGFEWTKYNSLTPQYREQFIKWISAFGEQNLKGLYIVDAGCGMGRNSYWANEFGARKIFAFDVEGSTVEVAKKNLASTSGVTVSQMSIYNCVLPNDEKADLVFSIGVIHHLIDPVLALTSLKNLVKPGGALLIWVYGKEGNVNLLRLLKPIRMITRKTPMYVLSKITSFLTIFLFLYLKSPLPKNSYFEFISKFQFWHLNSILLDQFLPKIAHYWTRDEVHQLLKDAGLKDIKIKAVNGMSWSAVGKV